MMRTTAVLAVACVFLGASFAHAGSPPKPTIPTDYSVSFNLTAEFATPPTTRSGTFYIGFNNAFEHSSIDIITVDNGNVHASVATNFGRDCFDYNPRSKSCDVSCDNGVVPGSNSSGCACATVNLFAMLEMATYNGTCARDGTLWSYTMPGADDDGTHYPGITLSFCFEGNVPVYIDEILDGSAPSTPVRRLLASQSDDDDDTRTPLRARFTVLSFKNSPAPETAFKAPAYCKM